ncbi:hypothetical protein B0H11DRAFT_2040851, partial [Mycena galericulata]
TTKLRKYVAVSPIILSSGAWLSNHSMDYVPLHGFAQIFPKGFVLLFKHLFGWGFLFCRGH